MSESSNRSAVFIILIIIGLTFFWNLQSVETDTVPESETHSDTSSLETTDETEVAQWSFPMDGAIHFLSDAFVESDKSALKNIRYLGRNKREMQDAMLGKQEMNIYLFEVDFDDDTRMGFWVSPDFETRDSARIQVEKYAKIMGQLPQALRKKTYYLAINKGYENFQAQISIVHVYTEMAKIWERDNLLEEVLIHEAAHAALDFYHVTNGNWLDVQQADGRFLTTYAQENPETEDLAESFTFYLAARYRGDRLEPEIRDSIFAVMPNRVHFFDNLNLNVYPIK